ncbi:MULTISPECIES: hypothetical protein [Pseudomonas]|uniref:Uncharacterized protein n=1 Tax=Pseudomonas sp. WC2401 TaxID=3234143 RepID=A0AB39X1H1_9PSED
MNNRENAIAARSIAAFGSGYKMALAPEIFHPATSGKTPQGIDAAWIGVKMAASLITPNHTACCCSLVFLV